MASPEYIDTIARRLEAAGPRPPLGAVSGTRGVLRGAARPVTRRWWSGGDRPAPCPEL